MPIVHGGLPSPFVKKVCAFLAEKGITPAKLNEVLGAVFFPTELRRADRTRRLPALSGAA